MNLEVKERTRSSIGLPFIFPVFHPPSLCYVVSICFHPIFLTSFLVSALAFSHYLPHYSSALLPYLFPFILRMFCLYLFAWLHFLYFLHSIFIVILPLTSFKILLYNWKLLEYFRVPPKALNAVDLQETHPVMKEGSISNCVSRRLLC